MEINKHLLRGLACINGVFLLGYFCADSPCRLLLSLFFLNAGFIWRFLKND